MGFADRIKALFKKQALDDDAFEDLADLLVEGDMGAAFAVEIVDSLKALCKKNRVDNPEGARRLLKELLRPYTSRLKLELDQKRPEHLPPIGGERRRQDHVLRQARGLERQRGVENIVLAAGDTFRAAAVDQLKIHGQRANIRVVAQHQGADAAAVLWDSIETVGTQGSGPGHRGYRWADAYEGRSGKKLEKMNKVIAQRAPGAVYRKILVLDSTTGQNGMRQAETFHQAVRLDGVILSKYDSTAKGGMVLSLARQFGLATLFVGTGEGYADFSPFDPDGFLDDFIGL